MRDPGRHADTPATERSKAGMDRSSNFLLYREQIATMQDVWAKLNGSPKSQVVQHRSSNVVIAAASRGVRLKRHDALGPSADFLPASRRSTAGSWPRQAMLPQVEDTRIRSSQHKGKEQSESRILLAIAQTRMCTRSLPCRMHHRRSATLLSASASADCWSATAIQPAGHDLTESTLPRTASPPAT